MGDPVVSLIHPLVFLVWESLVLIAIPKETPKLSRSCIFPSLRDSVVSLIHPLGFLGLGELGQYCNSEGDPKESRLCNFEVLGESVVSCCFAHSPARFFGL